MNRDAAAYWIVRSSRTMTIEFDARSSEFDAHSSHHPPCLGVMISISSPFLICVCAHLLFGSTS
jgi:hypothetical protein